MNATLYVTVQSTLPGTTGEPVEMKYAQGSALTIVSAVAGVVESYENDPQYTRLVSFRVAIDNDPSV